MLILWPLLAVLVAGQSQLFDYGEPFGDQVFDYSSDQRAVALDIPVVFLETTQTEFYISSNGIVGFGEKLPEVSTPLQKMERYTIAVYYAPAVKGRVYYRSTSSDQHTLRLLCDYIHQAFADSSDFQCLQGVVVTWDGLEPAESEEKATFQLAVVSDGITSFAIKKYKKLPWASSSGIYAQVGFSGKHSAFLTNVNSGGPEVKELASLSNNEVGNSFTFRISGSNFEDPKENSDEYEYRNYDTDYEGQERKAPPADCPVDTFKDQCPDGCNILTDDRGCSRCICAEEVSAEEDESVEKQPTEAPIVPYHRQELPDVQQNKVDIQGKTPEQPTSHQREQAPRILEYEPRGTGLSCDAAGEAACHANGICRDYDEGYCCTCQPGHYGNGKECLKKGDPQRISGFFEGVINGKAVERTDLHTFITATDGNAYTAVSKIPSDLGGPFLLLQSIGSVMGWLFAEVHGSSIYNGFQLTGGLFNRTATLHIGDRYYVTVKQEFSGRDIYHYFKASVFVSGSLPDISPDTEVVIPDYEEEYKRESAGLVRSYTGMDILLRENGQERTMRMTVDQQIHYKECPYKAFEKEQTTYLKVKRVHVTYDANEGIVRYASRNYVAPQGTPSQPAQPPQGSVFERRQHGQTQQPAVEPVQLGNDVCTSGRHQCTLPHMRCRTWEHSYRCECFEGFSAVHDTASHIGWKCEDLNECDRGDHTCSQDATCLNTEGGFTCECNPGFTGDGHNCLSNQRHVHQQHHHQQQQAQSYADLTPARLNPGECTSHQQCHQYGECAFTPGVPTGICKCRGWYVGDGVQHCGPPQETSRPQQHNANLQHRGGKPCGEHVCDQNAECMPARHGGSECVCKAGFEGDGIRCTSLDEDDERQESEDRTVGTVCRSHDECSEHGSCQYSHALGYYRCACTDPYVGDGVQCTLAGAPVIIGSASSGCDVTRDCHQNADCVYERTHEGGLYRCICQSGFSGDGKYCTKTDQGVALPPLEQPGCDRLNNCDPNAQCVFDSHNYKYRCECYEGFAGDGMNCVKIHSGVTNWEGTPARPKICREQQDCHRNAHCVVGDVGDEYICECLPGYRGDGVHSCIVADQCNPNDPGACHQNAECVYGNEESAYVCKCVQGFTGDGVSCVAHGGVSSCQTNPRMCHANAQCVFHQEQNTHVCICKPGSVGDGYQRCDVQETPRCTDCSVHAHCAQSPTTGGYQCKCNAGYQGNGNVCYLQTSCLDDRSICDVHAECVPGEGGQYVCNCHYGYHGNGRTCSPDSENRKDTLFVARGMAIFQRGTKPDVPGKQLIVIPHHIAVGLDFDCEQERIVWSDISGHSIRSASLNGTEMNVHFAEDLNSPEGIAVDWSSRNVYYADSLNDEIGVASLDGKYKKALVTEGLVNPRAVALDLYGRHVYYTDWHRENPVIGRVDMDGKNNKVFINIDIHLPNGLTVLPNRKELCWVDAGSHRLSCVGLDGNNRRVVHAPLEYPFGLTHDNEQRFYWTDWKDNKIHTVGVYGEAYSSFPISLGGSGKVYGILSVPKTCPGPTSPCADNNGGCKYMCLPGQEGVKCECPDNVAVKGC